MIFKEKDNICVTEKLQTAIDEASKMGEELVVSRGVYVVGTLFLRSNLKLKLEKGAVILGSGEFSDYSEDVDLFTDAVDHKRGRSLVYAENAENVEIYGEGIIDGRGALFSSAHPKHDERPFLVRILNSKNIRIRGITLKNPAAWTLHMLGCDGALIEGVYIHSRVNANNDGIDVDSSCNVSIKDCIIDSGDDAICLKSTYNKPCRNIKVSGCTITTNWAGFKVGTESVGDYENISFEDSFIYDCNGCAIKLCPVDGASLKGLTVRNIRLENATGPIFIANGSRMRVYHEGHKKSEPGSISDVLIENVHGSCIDAIGTVYKGEAWGNAKTCVCISGTKENAVRNVTLKNISLRMAGGVTEYEEREVPEMGDRYPEFHNFGVLPACGLYIRHAENVKCESVNFKFEKEDIRPEIVKA